MENAVKETHFTGGWWVRQREREVLNAAGSRSLNRSLDPGALALIMHERIKWDRHPACLSWLTGWKPIPRVDE
jgi:hypothetical protein